MKNRRAQGLVVRVTGGAVWVEVEGETLACMLRGRFRKTHRNFQVVAGDRVEVLFQSSAGVPGAIEAVLPRTSWLARFVGGKDSREKVLVANIDTLFLVASVKSPDIAFGFIDRVLVSAERGHIGVCLCLNKVDLGPQGSAVEEFRSLYSGIGYRVIETSALTGAGVGEITSTLRGGIYAFVGQSGVGKSSLLNSIDPGLKLKVSAVAGKTGRGRHTTTYSQLFPIDLREVSGGPGMRRAGYLADTPGMQTFGFPGTDKTELSECFREFREFAGQCRFQPCTHSHEPGCAVRDAHGGGRVHTSRLGSYLEILSEVEARERRRYS